MVLIGQHTVYCHSSRIPDQPSLDVQVVNGELHKAKELIQSVMEELRVERDARDAGRQRRPQSRELARQPPCKKGFASRSSPMVVDEPCPGRTLSVNRPHMRKESKPCLGEEDHGVAVPVTPGSIFVAAEIKTT